MINGNGTSKGNLDVIESFKEIILGYTFFTRCVTVETWPSHINPFLSDITTFEALGYAVIVHNFKESLEALLVQQARAI